MLIDDTEPSFNDVVLAYNDDILVGSSYWAGKNTAVPVMGDEGGITLDGLVLDCDLSGTCDYMEHGDTPRFAIWNHSELTLIVDEYSEYNGLYPAFSNLDINSLRPGFVFSDLIAFFNPVISD